MDVRADSGQQRDLDDEEQSSQYNAHAKPPGGLKATKQKPVHAEYTSRKEPGHPLGPAEQAAGIVGCSHLDVTVIHNHCNGEAGDEHSEVVKGFSHVAFVPPPKAKTRRRRASDG